MRASKWWTWRRWRIRSRRCYDYYYWWLLLAFAQRQGGRHLLLLLLLLLARRTRDWTLPSTGPASRARPVGTREGTLLERSLATTVATSSTKQGASASPVVRWPSCRSTPHDQPSLSSSGAQSHPVQSPLMLQKNEKMQRGGKGGKVGV